MHDLLFRYHLGYQIIGNLSSRAPHHHLIDRISYPTINIPHNRDSSLPPHMVHQSTSDCGSAAGKSVLLCRELLVGGQGPIPHTAPPETAPRHLPSSLIPPQHTEPPSLPTSGTIPQSSPLSPSPRPGPSPPVPYPPNNTPVPRYFRYRPAVP
jgi:hypothetical protein